MFLLEEATYSNSWWPLVRLMKRPQKWGRTREITLCILCFVSGEVFRWTARGENKVKRLSWNHNILCCSLKETTAGGYSWCVAGSMWDQRSTASFLRRVFVLACCWFFLSFLLKCMILDCEGDLHCLDKTHMSIVGSWNLQIKRPKSEIKTESCGSDGTALNSGSTVTGLIRINGH